MNFIKHFTKGISFLFFIVMLTSCYDNSIYFNLENQSIKTCNGRELVVFYLKKKDDPFLYFYNLKLDKVGTNEFSLKEINRNYILEYKGKSVDVGDFKLSPNSKYEIVNHSSRDATDASIQIETDSCGNVIFSNVTSCH
jgi:hypothetical protein